VIHLSGETEITVD